MTTSRRGILAAIGASLVALAGSSLEAQAYRAKFKPGFQFTAPATVPTLPTLGAAYSAVRGTQTMVSGYTGPLFQLRRVSDGATQDFAAASGGLPSDSAISTFTGASTAYFSKFYDQTGNGFHLVTPTSNSAMSPVDLTQKSPSGALWFNSIDATSGTTASTGHSIDMQNHSFFAVVQQVNGAVSTLGSLDAGSGGNVLSDWISTKGWVRDRSTANGYLSYAAQGVQPLRANPVVIGQTFTASNRRFYLAETSNTAAAAGAGTATRVVYGLSNFSLETATGMRWCGDLITSAALSTSDGTTLQSSLAAMFSIPTSFDRRLLLIGDSIMSGYQETLHKTIWERVGLVATCEVISTAVAGELMTSEASGYLNYTPFVTSKYGAGRMTVLIESGTNDIAPPSGSGAQTDTQLFATLNTFNGRFRTAYSAVKIINMQLLPRADTGTNGWSSNANFETYRQNYNSKIAGNAGGGSNPADVVFLQGDTSSTMGSSSAPSNTTLFNPDHLHPANTGAQYLATGQPTPPASGPSSYAAAIAVTWS